MERSDIKGTNPDLLKDIAVGAVLNEKWHLIAKIGNGVFGRVFEGTDIRSGEEVAIKAVRRHPNASLRKEYEIGRELCNAPGVPKGIPHVKFFGMTWQDFYLVTERLGHSLSELMEKQKERRFSMHTVAMIGMQILDVLEFVHDKGYVHLDVKPENILVGNSESTKGQVYLIDFGLVQKYTEGESGQPLSADGHAPFMGSMLFASRHRHRLRQISRRDDIESLIYTIIFLVTGTLPWYNIGLKGSFVQRRAAVGGVKEREDPQRLTRSLPEQFRILLTYVFSLEVQSNPDYSHLRAVLASMLEEETDKMDWMMRT